MLSTFIFGFAIKIAAAIGNEFFIVARKRFSGHIVVVFGKECGWSVTQFASITWPERPFLFAHGISPFCRIFGSFCTATDFRPSTPKRVKPIKGFLWSDDFQRSQPLRPMQTITPERSLIYETVHLPYKLVISRRIWEFGKITVCEPALFFQRAAVPNDALPSDHAVSVIPQSVGSGSAGLSHKAARRMASVILSEPWPQPRFSLLLPYFYIQVCHFNRVDKNQNSLFREKRAESGENHWQLREIVLHLKWIVIYKNSTFYERNVDDRWISIKWWLGSKLLVK